VPAENFPFCTIDPSVSKVPVPDERFDHLVSIYKPKSVVPAVLTVTDIAGLVKGASEGAGLGNAFLSNIQAVDGIFHVCRAFGGDEITHVEGRVDPVEDLAIIHNELRLKDIGIVQSIVDGRRKNVERGMGGKEAKEEFASLEKCLAWLLTGKDVRQGEWSSGDVEAINKLQLITAKPMVYLVNLSEKDFARKGNKFLEPLAAWVKARGTDDKMIPFSCEFEAKIADLGSAEEREAYCKDLGEKVVAAAAAAAVLVVAGVVVVVAVAAAVVAAGVAGAAAAAVVVAVVAVGEAGLRVTVRRNGGATARGGSATDAGGTVGSPGVGGGPCSPWCCSPTRTTPLLPPLLRRRRTSSTRARVTARCTEGTGRNTSRCAAGPCPCPGAPKCTACTTRTPLRRRRRTRPPERRRRATRSSCAQTHPRGHHRGRERIRNDVLVGTHPRCVAISQFARRSLRVVAAPRAGTPRDFCLPSWTS
jgi:ribosome-binding ATPase YchF (GTP1/OBG family)